MSSSDNKRVASLSRRRKSWPKRILPQLSACWELWNFTPCRTWAVKFVGFHLPQLWGGFFCKKNCLKPHHRDTLLSTNITFGQWVLRFRVLLFIGPKKNTVAYDPYSVGQRSTCWSKKTHPSPLAFGFVSSIYSAWTSLTIVEIHTGHM